MRLATRLFALASLLVAATVVAVILLSDQILRRHFEAEVAAGLAREARLATLLVPADSTRWPEAARSIGRLIGHRVTLIDPHGRVRGDTEFDIPALADLENHLMRPEVQAALDSGTGTAQRLSVSTNQRRLYVAIRAGPPGLAIVRVSATLDTVDAQVQELQRAVAGAGVAAILVAAFLAWLASRALARPLVGLSVAARDIATGRTPTFPDSHVPEVADHILALRAMGEQLDQRFAELLREREEVRTLIDAMADGVVATDAGGAIVTMNAAARRFLGYGPETSLPRLDELFHDKSARDLVADLRAGGESEARELAIDRRTLLATGRPLPAGGALLVLRDVTALRRLETVRRDFVANVSHELKTPLTSIAGYAETLAAEAGADAPGRRFADTILANARRMQRLVDDLLDLSRIESGGWRPAPQSVDVEAAAREAWAPFVERAASAGVRFAVTVPAPARVIEVDPDALRQILTNLYDNALRHTPRGGEITTTVARRDATVELSVRDTGSGILPEHLPRVFERFYRADPARSRAHGGTGLGLAIVRHLVEAHGGRVEALSGQGEGATIRMEFPVTQS